MRRLGFAERLRAVAVAGHALAYDAARGVTVLFGGDDSNETWEWDGVAWTLRSPNELPPARSQHALTYDAARGVVLLFGGVASAQPLNDTWTWDGSQWTQLFPASSPTPRAGHALAYDAARGRVVLFGGVGAGHAVRGDTWEWDGSPGAPGWTLRDEAGTVAALWPCGRVRQRPQRGRAVRRI